MVAHQYIRTEPIQQISRRELDQLDSSETRANWLAFTTTVGFEVKSARPLQTLQAGLPGKGIRANLPERK